MGDKIEIKILPGDVLNRLKDLDDESVHCVVTSPPYYGLRDYGVEGQIGLEETPEKYVKKMVEVFKEVRRVLRSDGTLWLNLGDSYAGSGKGAWKNKKIQKEVYIPDPDSPQCLMNKVPIGLKPKDLIGIPWRVAFALQEDGWWLRQDIIYSKPNPMPESVTDRCTKSHEYIFLLSKSEKYYYDQESIKEPASYSTEERKSRSQDGNKRLIGNGVNAIHPKKSDKQRGHSRRHTGFNERWDQMTKEEQCSGMRNKRSVWTVATRPFPEAHFATFPEELIQPCILAGCPEGGIVLDPFGGSGTTAVVASSFSRNSVLIELNQDYIQMSIKRIKKRNSLFTDIFIL